MNVTTALLHHHYILLTMYFLQNSDLDCKKVNNASMFSHVGQNVNVIVNIVVRWVNVSFGDDQSPVR